MKSLMILVAALSIQILGGSFARAYTVVIPECAEPDSSACRFYHSEMAAKEKKDEQDRANDRARSARNCTAAMHRKFGKKIASFSYDGESRSYWSSSTTICECAVDMFTFAPDLTCYPLAQ